MPRQGVRISMPEVFAIVRRDGDKNSDQGGAERHTIVLLCVLVVSECKLQGRINYVRFEIPGEKIMPSNPRNEVEKR